MGQVTRFPYTPRRDPSKTALGLIEVCRVIGDGVTIKELRRAMRERELYNRARLDDTLRFFRLAKAKTIEHSEVTRTLADAVDDAAALAALRERLWSANPLLMKAVLELLGERGYTRDEIFTYLESFAYRGQRISRPQLEDWFRLAIGLELVKVVGIALSLAETGREWLNRAAELEVDEFLEDDEPEPALPGYDDAEGNGTEVSADATPAESTPPSDPSPPTASDSVTPIAPEVPYTSPLGRQRPVQIAVLRGPDAYDGTTLDETADRIRAWWSEQTPVGLEPRAADFGLDGERWMDNSEEALYRLAVAAALIFRLNRTTAAVVTAYHKLDSAGVLRDLYFGTAPESLPAELDAQSLMLASLVARRCAESPELAGELERTSDAASAFEALDRALGGGLFSLELFWLLGALADIGAIRHDDISQYTSLPTRRCRDTLYRLGFLTSPYAEDSHALARAAAAMRRLAGPEEASVTAMIDGFAMAAGCHYDCPNKKRCEYACRERAEASPR